MNRRQFGQTFLSLVAAASIAPCGANPSTRRVGRLLEWDRFGGYKAKSFESTGYFRTEHDGKRWWLVSPEGNAFLSWGINHLHADLWRQDFNRDHWQTKLGIDDIKEWSQFSPALRKWFLDTCQQYGFNTVGVHNSLNVVNQPKPAMAYMQPITFVDIPHWKTEIPDDRFVDVFDVSFAQHCDRLAKQHTRPKDPFLLGYSMTDCPLLTEEDCRERPDVIGGARRGSRIGWPKRLRNLDENAAGKQVYVELMRKLYREQISQFNQTYETKFKSFADLQRSANWRPQTDLANGNETRDNIEFLKKVVDKYYRTTRDAIRRYDPHHLFFGDKLNGNTDSIDTVLPITSQYTDVVLYQMYARYSVQEPGLNRWSRAANKPIINGDASFTMITPDMPRPYGPVADNLNQRVQWTVEFFLRAFERSDFVGWHYCGLIDATQRIPRKQARQHSGLLTEMGEPYPELLKSIQGCSERLYDVAS